MSLSQVPSTALGSRSQSSTSAQDTHHRVAPGIVGKRARTDGIKLSIHDYLSRRCAKPTHQLHGLCDDRNACADLDSESDSFSILPLGSKREKLSASLREEVDSLVEKELLELRVNKAHDPFSLPVEGSDIDSSDEGPSQCGSGETRTQSQPIDTPTSPVCSHTSLPASDADMRSINGTQTVQTSLNLFWETGLDFPQEPTPDRVSTFQSHVGHNTSNLKLDSRQDKASRSVPSESSSARRNAYEGTPSSLSEKGTVQAEQGVEEPLANSSWTFELEADRNALFMNRLFDLVYHQEYLFPLIRNGLLERKRELAWHVLRVVNDNVDLGEEFEIGEVSAALQTLRDSGKLVMEGDMINFLGM